jgi:hypothetical protein
MVIACTQSWAYIRQAVKKWLSLSRSYAFLYLSRARESPAKDETSTLVDLARNWFNIVCIWYEHQRLKNKRRRPKIPINCLLEPLLTHATQYKVNLIIIPIAAQ